MRRDLLWNRVKACTCHVRDSATCAVASASVPSVSVIDVTEDEIKQRNTRMVWLALDDAFWEHGIREMHCIKNTNGEITLFQLTKDFRVEGIRKRRWKRVRRIL